MLGDDASNPAPQFKTAEFAGKPGEDRCASCGQPLSGSYYRVDGALSCATCAEKTKLQLPQDTHAGFMRGLLFGLGGALVGLILYATFAIITGWVIGYVSLAVGFIVGKAVMKGSRGIGGRRYQIAAAALTYAAVSVAAIPIGIAQIIKEKKNAPTATVTQPVNSPAPAGQAGAPPAPADSQTSEPADNAPTSLGAALFSLLLVGLISPFLELQSPTSGLIGLVILFIGIQIAWKLTAQKAVEILGPFAYEDAASKAASAG